MNWVFFCACKQTSGASSVGLWACVCVIVCDALVFVLVTYTCQRLQALRDTIYCVSHADTLLLLALLDADFQMRCTTMYFCVASSAHFTLTNWLLSDLFQMQMSCYRSLSSQHTLLKLWFNFSVCILMRFILNLNGYQSLSFQLLKCRYLSKTWPRNITCSLA